MAADAEGDSMINTQQDQALNPQPAPAAQSQAPEAIPGSNTLKQLTAEELHLPIYVLTLSFS